MKKNIMLLFAVFAFLTVAPVAQAKTNVYIVNQHGSYDYYKQNDKHVYHHRNVKRSKRRYRRHHEYPRAYSRVRQNVIYRAPTHVYVQEPVMYPPLYNVLSIATYHLFH